MFIVAFNFLSLLFLPVLLKMKKGIRAGRALEMCSRGNDGFKIWEILPEFHMW